MGRGLADLCQTSSPIKFCVSLVLFATASATATTGTCDFRLSESTRYSSWTQQLNALGETRKSEIYHFEKHGQALASPSIYDAILFGERMIKAIERLLLD